jgi:hypothetical protein
MDSRASTPQEGERPAIFSVPVRWEGVNAGSVRTLV